MPASAVTAVFTLKIPTVPNDFKVLAFDGTEAISSLYAIHIELVSEHPDFDLKRLLSQPAFLQFGLNGEGLHGRIEDVRVGEPGRRLTHYHLTLVPALHYLQFGHDQRIFQKLTVQEIITQVLKQHWIQDDTFAFHVGPRLPREYCTQYGESNFEFIKRLCAEEGIAWHHQHFEDRHLLVFTDDQTFFRKLGQTVYQQDSGMVADHPVISRFSQRLSTRTSAITRRDYDLQRPNRVLERQAKSDFIPALEDYRYPMPIDDEKLSNQRARHALERHRVDHHLAEGESDQPTLRSGHFFDLAEHPRKACNDLWLLLSVTHAGKQPQVLEESADVRGEPENGFSQGYRNHFSATAWDVFYRPPLDTRRPMLASQTARVTGPVGEEIHCDEFGRVKVEFPWDRAGLNSERSSCWLRVSSSWAGERFGSVSIPRVGMEVVVTYLEGDPDQPLITGCVANAITSTPYPLPAHKTKTVLRSRSSPHTGGYNELSIEDRAGKERIYLRAERDLEQLIRNDSDTRVGNDRREHITRDSHSLTGNDRFEQVDNNSASLIKGEEKHTTQGRRNTVIDADDLLSIGGNGSTTAAGTLVIQAGPHARVTARQVVIDAGASLTLTAGGHHIVINSAGIFSSQAIAEGGSPGRGIGPQAASSVVPAASQALATLSLAAQTSALTQAAQRAEPVCAVCEKPAATS